MKLWKKIAIGIAVLLAAAYGFVRLALPDMVTARAAAWLKENTGRELSVGRLALRPLFLTAEVRDLRLSEPQSADTFVSLKRGRISVSARSVLRGALILDEVTLDAPAVRIVRDRGGSFNFADLAAGEEKAEAQEEKAPLRFSVNNLRIAGGAVNFTDRTLDPEKTHRIRDLELSVPFFGNVPYLAEKYATPRFSAVIDNSPVALEGRLKPFAEMVEASGRLDLKDLNLPVYMAHVPGALPVRIESGRLATEVEVVYRASAAEKPELQLSGSLTLTGLSMRDRTGEEVFFLPLAEIPLMPSRPLEREVHLGPVRIYGLEVFVARDDLGRWNHERLTPAQGETEESPEPPSEENGEPFLATVEEVRLRNGKILFADALPPGGYVASARDVNLDVGPFATSGNGPTPFGLTLETEREERVSVEGEFTLTPFALRTDVSAGSVLLGPVYPYLADLLTAPVSGELDARAEIRLDGEGLTVSGGGVEIRNLRAPFGPEDGFALARLAVEGAGYNAAENRVEVETVALERGDLSFSRDPAGKLSPLLLLRQKPEAGKEAAQEGNGGSPLSYRVGKISGSGWELAFRDEVPSGKPAFRLSALEFSLQNLAGPQPAESPFGLTATYGRGAGIELSGRAVLATPGAGGTVRLGGIPLPDFAPYLPENVRAEPSGGRLYATVEFDARTGKEGLRANFGGDVMIRAFTLLDGRRRAELLRLGNLQVEGIRGSVAPFVLEIGKVSLSDYAAKVAIDEEGSINLQDVVAAGEEEAEAPPPVEEESGPPPKIRIGAVTLQGGTVDFSDRHLRPAFSTTMFNLGGSINGIDSSPGTMARVDLRGNLQNQSPLNITGRLHPFGKPFFLELKVSFTDIELTPMTPYSETYLGYTVEKGKLFLDLSYRIEEKALDSQNRIFLDQFTLGRKVESEEATGLPVKLALALLKDRKGEIRLDVPVTGRTDDPQFSVFSVVLKFLKNLLVKAATSPLSLLQAAFGGAGADFSAVAFPSGSSELAPPEAEKLRRLAAALVDRPGLRLEIRGFVDPERDPEGLRRHLLQQKMEEEKYRRLPEEDRNLPGQPAAEVRISPEERPELLEAVYKKADFPKPRGFLGLPKSLPGAEMEKLILAHTPAGPDELLQLARSRAARVMNFLLTEGGLPKDRLFLLRPDLAASPAKEGSGRSVVEFGVSTK